MIGLMFLLVLIPYCVLVLWLTIKGMNIGRKKFGNQTSQARRKVYAYGLAGFLLGTLPVFWEAIPTYVSFKIAMNQEVGLKLNKSFEQWRSENPEVTLDNLRQKGGSSLSLPNGIHREPLNERVHTDTVKRLKPFTVVVQTEKLIDSKNLKVLAEITSVWSGNSGGLASGGEDWWKFWLVHDSNDITYVDRVKWAKILENYTGKDIVK
jgi:hypothetical protein